MLISRNNLVGHEKSIPRMKPSMGVRLQLEDYYKKKKRRKQNEPCLTS